MARLSTTTVVRFPFRDFRLDSSDYSDDSLGRFVDDATGELKSFVDFCPGNDGHIAAFVRCNVPRRSVEEEQTLQSSLRKTLDFFHVEGTVGLNLFAFGVEGTFGWDHSVYRTQTSVHYLQKCTVVVGCSELDVPAIRRATARSRCTATDESKCPRCREAHLQRMWTDRGRTACS